MSDYYYPAYRPDEDSRCGGLVRLAALGAVVGGAVAAAASLARIQREEITANQAVAETARTMVASAAATVVAGAAASVVAEQGLVRLGVLFATGTAVLYGIDRLGRERQGLERRQDRDGPGRG